MKGFISRSLAVLSGAFMLTACNTDGSQTEKMTSNSVQDSMAEVPNDALPPDPFSPLSYAWNTHYAANLTPPEEVRTAANAACAERGFDIAVMTSISLTNDQAAADFSCRGQDN